MELIGHSLHQWNHFVGKKSTDIGDSTCKSGNFWNFGVTKISVTIEGIPNKLFSNGILPTDIYEECKCFFSGSGMRDLSITQWRNYPYLV